MRTCYYCITCAPFKLHQGNSYYLPHSVTLQTVTPDAYRQRSLICAIWQLHVNMYGIVSVPSATCTSHMSMHRYDDVVFTDLTQRIPRSIVDILCRESSGNRAQCDTSPAPACPVAGPCGRFAITAAYFAVCSAAPYGAHLSSTDFRTCARNYACAQACVRNYLFQNKDACTVPAPAVTPITRIGCERWARIHRVGPPNCNRPLLRQLPLNARRYIQRVITQCIDYVP